MVNKKTIALITTIVTILVGGGLAWQLDPIDLHTTNCSYFKLKEGMNNDQLNVFNLFINANYCDIGDCKTGLLKDEFRPILEQLGKENPEFHRRIVYYLETCKVSEMKNDE